MLTEKDVPKAKLKERADALEKMGKIFCTVGAEFKESSDGTEDSEAKRRLAQDRVEKALHDTLAKMDEAEGGGGSPRKE